MEPDTDWINYQASLIVVGWYRENGGIAKSVILYLDRRRFYYFLPIYILPKN